MPDTLEVSIVIPCLNEARTVGRCVEKAAGWLRRAGVSGEVLVADNGSTDGSQAAVTAAGGHVVPVAQRGYGSALMGGIAASRGRFVIMGDADDTYDFSRLDAFVERLRAGDDLVVGNRYQGGIQSGAMPPLNRYIGNPVLTACGRLLFRSRVGDFYCGLRAFRREAVLRMDMRATGMEFAIEQVVKAALLGLQVSEVPTTLSPDAEGRRPHLRPLRDGWRTIRFMLLYSPRWLFLYPGLLLMAAGLAAGLWILPAPRSVGTATYDVHTLLYAAAAVLIGFQGVCFAVFCKFFAISEGLLPPDPRVMAAGRVITLEVGLAAGAVLALAGLAGSAYALIVWERHAFGPLDISRTMRLVIPSVTSLVLGCQIILSSFFLSVLWVRRREAGLER